MKILIVYGTRKGTTTKTSEVISNVLSDEFSHEVEVYPIKHKRRFIKRLTDFDLVIVGSSIVSGRWVNSCKNLLKKFRRSTQPLAIFVTAGGTMHKVQKYGIQKSDAIQDGIEKYIDKYVDKYKLNPVSKMVLGGRVMKKGVARYDNWNEEDIKNWTRELAKMIEK